MLEDPERAPIAPGLKATLAFLGKLTLSPSEVGSQDAERVLAAGVSEGALADAIHVCALFNVIDRIADAMGFRVGPPEEFARAAQVLLKRGYRL